MDIEQFRKQLGSWTDVLEPFVSSPAMDKIFAELKSRRSKGIQTAPESINVFKCFELCDYNNLSIILIGLSPYHTFWLNKPIADGLMMSCSITGKLQPSLEQLYEGINDDLYEGKGTLTKSPDLTFLARQGVLLMNIGLTVQKDKAGSDTDLWQPFIKFLIEEVLNKYPKPLIFVFLGKEAEKYEKLVIPFNHYRKTVQHPAASAYTNTKWKHDKVFSWIKKIMTDNFQRPIIWDKDLLPF